jgi:hypothetical protein
MENRHHAQTDGEPAAAGYRSVTDLRARERLIPQSSSALAVVLSELDLH